MFALGALFMSCGSNQKSNGEENEVKDTIVVQDSVLVDTVEVANVSDSVAI